MACTYVLVSLRLVKCLSVIVVVWYLTVVVVVWCQSVDGAAAVCTYDCVVSV